MQHTTPPTGPYFDSNRPQEDKTYRFTSNDPLGARPYEPQPRMQQTGSVPVIQMPRYATGQLQALHNAPPVSQMPPMAQMPTASAWEAQQAAAQKPVQGKPVIVRTTQGTPVLITREELERALQELQEAEKPRTRKGRKSEKTAKKEQVRPRRSLLFTVFSMIGVISVVLLLIEWVAIPLLVILQELIGGAK